MTKKICDVFKSLCALVELKKINFKKYTNVKFNFNFLINRIFIYDQTGQRIKIKGDKH